MHILLAIAVGIIYSSAAFALMQLVEWIEKKRVDSIEPKVISPFTFIPMLLSPVIVGMFFMLHTAPIRILVVTGVACASLIALTYSDIRWNRTSVWISLPALALVISYESFAHNGTPIVSASIASLPFLLSFATTRGRGASLNDVIAIALGASVLGIVPAVMALATSSLLVVAVSAFKNKKKKKSKVAFTPFLTACVLVALIATPGS